MAIRQRWKYPEKEECMKNMIVTVTMGMCLTLATGAAFASGQENHDGKKFEQADRHESKIYGTVQAIPNGSVGIWTVNGREINVTKSTNIKEKHGKAEVGSYVEVNGSFSGNTLHAYKIEVKRDSREIRKIRGTIESSSTGTNGTWIVNGEKILLNQDTFIREKHGRAVVGAYVEVEGVSSGNGFSARNIEVKRAKR